MHFNKLNYSFANESTEIEVRLLEENIESVFAIAGSGSRCLPLLSKNPKKLDIYDSSLPQLFITELRFSAVRLLKYDEFLKLLGYQECSAEERIILFNKLDLSLAAKNYWIQTQNIWSKNGFLLMGSWEKKLQILRKVFNFFHFKDLNRIFKNNLKQEFPQLSWKMFCKTVLNEFIFRHFLYSGTSKYNLDLSFGDFLKSQFSKQIMHSNDLNSEFFLKLLFTGEVDSDPLSWPLEAQKDVFEKAKKSKTEVKFHQKNLTEIQFGQHQFYSLSDCFSYLDDNASQKIMNQISGSNLNSTTVLRYFMYQPRLDFSGLQTQEIPSEHDKVPIYKILSVYKR